MKELTQRIFSNQINFRVLDAPNITDDFYTELIDWGSNNILATVLECEVYMWNPDTGDIGVILLDVLVIYY